MGPGQLSVVEVPIVTPLRIASVPSDHLDVCHLAAPTGLPAVTRLPDPARPDARPGQWWPSPVLERRGWSRHAGSFELVHEHFGFEHRTAAELAAFVTTVVVTHFEQPRQLGMVLAALARQTQKPLDIVVADDGSATSAPR